jgi:hypothetical protein
MKSRAKYFDNRGTEVSDDEAFDSHGTLRNGFSMRVPLTMRDAATGSVCGEVEGDLCTRNGWPGTLRRGADGELFCDIGRKDAKPQFTDGRTTDPTALNRPGFRVPVVNDRRAVHDAYARYQTGLVNAYRVGDGEVQCPKCFGSGEDEDGDCDACNGTGIMAASKGGKGFGSSNEGGYDNTPDPASDALTMKDHRQTMDRLYRERDEELANMWRNR